MSKYAYSNTYLIDQNDKGLLSNSVQSLYNELQIPSIVKLQDALNDPNITIDQVKSDNKIIQDLIDMLPAQPEITGAFPKPGSFLNSSTRLTDDAKEYLEPLLKSQNIESVAATVLLALDEIKTKLALRETLSSTLQAYKSKLEAQTALDKERMIYLVKDSDGEVQPITDIDRLKDKLSAEQRGFIIGTWNQATFDSGWVTRIMPQEKAIEQNKLIEGDKVRNPILIDLSGGQVKLYNSVDMITQSITSGDKAIHSKATLELDISGLKGTEYNPCATTNPFTIKAIVTELDPSLPFDVNETSTKETSPAMHDYVRQNCIEGKLYGVINETNLDKKTRYQERLAAEINASEDNRKMYCDVAAERFDKFSKTSTGILGSKEKERIKQVVIEFMTPLCKDAKEKAALETNAGKLVRECASQAGVTQSWSQAWSKFKDSIGNFVNYIIGKENAVTKIIKNNTEITEALKNSMKIASEQANTDLVRQTTQKSKDSFPSR